MIMGNNSDIPKELYYLAEGFSAGTLRKYQLKQILTDHMIPHLNSIPRIDLIKLFEKNIQAKREEILKTYRQKQQKHQQAEQAVIFDEQLGRGHREIKRPTRLEDELLVRRTGGESSSSVYIKDADGFAIPSLPRRNKQKPVFNAEDSFASENDDDEYQAKPRPTPKLKSTVIKERSNKKAINGVKKAPSSIAPAATAPLPKLVVAKTMKKKFTPPAFNAEDSFAESEDDERPPKKSETIDLIDNSDKHQQDEEEEEEDTDYLGDDDGTDDEDEDIGEVDKEELVLLYKDQAIPPEVFISSEHRITTRAQKMAAAAARLNAWKIRLNYFALIICTCYMVVASLGLLTTGYARQKNGYCQTYPVLDHKETTSILSNILPSSCIPCPDHGICINGELECDVLYERKTPFYNLKHLLPIADDCVHNSVLGKYVGKVERKIKQELAMRQGEAACEYLVAHKEGGKVPVTRVLINDILNDLKNKMETQLPADKIEEILVVALSSVFEDPHIHYWETDDQRYLGTDQAQYPLTCQLRLMYREIPYYVKQYIFLFFVIATVVYGVSKDHRKNMEYKEKINSLVKSTTDQLKQQYDNHVKDPINYDTPALSVPQIRSGIVDVNDVRTIHDWQRVVHKMEAHPHIRKSFKEVRGDPVEYWELTA